MRKLAQYIGVLVCLFLVGCQPYPDHGDPIPDFRANSIEFGTRRELKLANFQGDEQSLVLQFNQPLQRLSEQDDPVPFELKFRPRIPVKSIRREGVSSVRVEFAERLPPAHAFRATIPPGWRALTGASFLRPHTVEWGTTRPGISKVEPVPGESAWRMTFNQPIDGESLNRCLELPGLTSEDYDVIPLDPTHYEVRILTSVAVASLRLAAGLESKVGKLPGVEQDFPLTHFSAGVFFCEKSEWLPHIGAVHLVFSEEVSRAELVENLGGLDRSAASQLYSNDNKDYTLYVGDVSRARNFTVSDSLTARSGSRLLHEVQVSVTPPDRPAPKVSFRPFQTVAPTATVLALRTVEKTRVATWRLDRKAAVSIMRLSDAEWAAAKKIPIEYTNPVYKHQLKKTRSATRFLEKDARSGGLFLVRVTTGDRVKRFLLARSDLMVEGWSLNGVVTGFAGRSNGIPLSDVALELCDSSGEVLEVAVSTPDGTAHFQAEEHRGVYLWANESLGTALAPVVHRQVTPPMTSPGLLWTHGKFFEPGQDSTYLGLWWSENDRPQVEVVDAGGEPVELSLGPPETVGPFFRGRFTVPDLPGEYRIRFQRGPGNPESAALVGASTFHVSRLAGQSGAPEVALELTQLGSGSYGGSYEWDGRGASLLGAEARLVAPQATQDGWERVRPGTPDLIPLGVERKVSMLGGNYEVTPLPPIQGRWNLIVEIFDRESPGTIVEQAVLELGEEEIKLLGCVLKPLSPTTTQARLSFEFARTESNGWRALYIRLEAEEAGIWKIKRSGEVPWLDGAYRWDASLPSRGSYRVVLSNELNGEPISVWRTTLRGSAAAPDQLKLNPQPIAPGQRLAVLWPEVREGSPVWLSLLTDKEQVNQRRSADVEGGLGEILVPKARLGEKELGVVSASLNPEVEIRSESVEVDTDTLYRSIDAELLSFRGDPSITTGQELQVQVPPLFRFGVVWWSYTDSETKDGKGLSKVVDFVQAGQELANLPMAGPTDLTEMEELPITAPPRSGRYDLRMLGLGLEGEVLFCRQTYQVSAESRWEPVTPDWLRPGDAFAAGIRFWADAADIGKTGATTSVVLESSLLPLSYQITAALVDPGSVADMLFSYRAPDFAAASEASRIHLVWELGVEGQAHRVETELAPLPTRVKTETFRQVTLERGRRRRLDVPLQGHWLVRLSVQEEGGALVAIDSKQVEAEHVNLAKAVAREFAGLGADAIEVELLSGHPVELEILELKPEPVEDSYSAAGLYMLRQLESVEGESVDLDDAEIVQSYLLAHYLVVPEGGESGYLVAPLPGGMRAKGAWVRKGEDLTPLHWSVGEGAVQAILPELSAGEHEIIVLVEAHVGGDYFWPGSKVVGIEEEVLSSTLSERVKIEWE